MWLTRRGPRLGLVATVREYRRRHLARAMLAAVFDVLAGGGHAEVSAEVDECNTPSLNLLGSLGAVQVGGTLDMCRPAGAGPA